MSKIISSKVRHRVRFAPSPNNDAFPTQPVFVETRLIRDITEYPKGVNYVSFDDIVETEIRLPDGSIITKCSEPFNDSGVYFVIWSKEKLKKLSAHWSARIDVHPTLKEKVFVIPTSLTQQKEQEI